MAKKTERHHGRGEKPKALKSSPRPAATLAERLRTEMIILVREHVEKKSGDDVLLREQAMSIAREIGLNPHDVQHVVPTALILARQIQTHEKLQRTCQEPRLVIARTHDAAVITLNPKEDAGELEGQVYFLALVYHNKVVTVVPWVGHSMNAASVVRGYIPDEIQRPVSLKVRRTEGASGL